MTNSGSYAYDAANRMKTAGGVSNDYDGDGNRVKHANGAGTLFYLWSSVLGEPVAEVTGGGVYRAYVYGPGGGQMLAMQSHDGGFYWAHTDHLGSGRKLTNTSGAVAYRGEFDPHGQALLEIPMGSYLNSHKFTGYERDWATNLDNAKARTYNNNRGRFMQADPLGLGAADLSDPQSLNLYNYVGNDPVNFVDPTGTDRIIAVTSCVTTSLGGQVIGIDCETTYYSISGGLPMPVGLPIYDTGGGGGGSVGNDGPGEILDDVQTGLDILGLCPGVGEPFDAMSAYMSYKRGDSFGAGVRAGAMLPFLGWFASIGKWGGKASGLGDLTKSEVNRIQKIVDQSGRPLEVVGSAASGTRRGVGTNLPIGKGPGTRSDIDYTVPHGSIDYFEKSGLNKQLPSIAPHGIVPGGHNPFIGPAIRFEPGAKPCFKPGR